MSRSAFIAIAAGRYAITGPVNATFLAPDGSQLDADMDMGITYQTKSGVEKRISTIQDTPLITPNPSHSNENVRVLNATDITTLDIIDITGRIVSTFSEHLGSICTFSTSGLPSGVYSTILHHQNGRLTQLKFIVV